MDEIEHLYRKHGIREISFNDDVFTADRERVLEICKLIVRRKLYIRFKCMSRVNTLCPERLEWLKKAGCYRIDFGVESGSKKILKSMKKRAVPDLAVRAFEMTRAAGIGTGCFIIVGFPGENDASIQATKRLIRKLKPNVLNLSSMSVFPGSPIHLNLLQRKQIDPDIWFKWKEHTILFIDDGDHDRHHRFLTLLREDYVAHEAEYGFTFKDHEAILNRYSGLGHAAVDLSSMLVNENRLPDALGVLSQAVNMEPENPSLWHHMSEICLRLGKIDVGLQAVEKALVLQPVNYSSRRLKARLVSASGDLDRAHQELATAIHSRPDKIEAYIEQGELYQKQHDYRQAIANYTLASRIDPYWQPLQASLKDCKMHIDRQAPVSC